MAREAEMHTLKKHVKTLHIPKDLNINKSWQFLKNDATEHIAGSGYTAVPYFFDVKAYQVGHIFVQEASNVNFENTSNPASRARLSYLIISYMYCRYSVTALNRK